MEKIKSDEQILVAIHCLVYNHEPYLRDCLNGFVMQKTNFRYVAIVHDDASIDNSASVIREYEEKYPAIIKPIYETENQYSKHDGSHRRIMNEAIKETGAKYVAFCEGDDYWTDPHKLQKQVEFLESHPEKDLCCSASKVYVQVTKSFEKVGGSALCEEYETCVQGTNDIYTATAMVRQDAWQNCISELSVILPSDLIFDTAYWYWFAYKRKVKFMDEPMAVYRVLENSASHTTDNKVESYMQWRFLRLKLYFLLYYPLLENHSDVIQCIISEIEKYAEWEHYCGQMEVRRSKKYKFAKYLTRLIRR